MPITRAICMMEQVVLLWWDHWVWMARPRFSFQLSRWFQHSLLYSSSTGLGGSNPTVLVSCNIDPFCHPAIWMDGSCFLCLVVFIHVYEFSGIPTTKRWNLCPLSLYLDQTYWLINQQNMAKVTLSDIRG